VTGAHITHLLRDTVEDTAAGFYNIPQEYLDRHGIAPTDVAHEAFRAWVKNRVQLARRCFATGRAYMARVENFRCRVAGYAYIGRFELILDAIERDNYRLRPAYPERKRKKYVLMVALSALAQSVGS
jgi:phytoene/squalene synthetase